VAEAAAILDIRDPAGQPALQILDDGCDCYRSHAVVRANDGITPSALRGVRDDLLSLLNRKIVPCHRFSVFADRNQPIPQRLADLVFRWHLRANGWRTMTSS